MNSIQELISGYYDEYYTKHNIDLSSRDGEDVYADALVYDIPTVETPTETAAVQSPTGTSSNKNYRKLLGDEKYAAIQRKATEWGKDTDAIAGIIWHESNGKTVARNRHSNATGIIQFMPSTAKHLGTTVDDIRNMSFDEQLDLTGKYFEGFGNKWQEAKTATDLYALVFYPAMSGKEGDYVLGQSKGDEFAGKVARQNKIFDLNKDNKITKDEFYEWGALKMALGGKFMD